MIRLKVKLTNGEIIKTTADKSILNVDCSALIHPFVISTSDLKISISKTTNII